jgi:prepilin-type N-terminal cleavage/methylation domain-containing protein
MKINSNLSKGFTLIELMVVISIIALLSSIVLASIKDARTKAVEASYHQYLKQYATALELYRNDNQGNYPTTATVSISIGGTYMVNSLSPYIKIQPAPSFVTAINPTRPFYVNKLTISSWLYSCGKAYNASTPKTEEPWVIFFESKTSLKFPLLYNEFGIYTSLGNTYYCISLSEY